MHRILTAAIGVLTATSLVTAQAPQTSVRANGPARTIVITDKAGLFVFRAVEPGSYIVELVGADQTVLAASDLLNVDAGDAVSAVVKLPFRLPPFGGLLGHTVASAAAIAATAAAAGVLAAPVTGEPVSARR
jgi:hypothetical protein